MSLNGRKDDDYSPGYGAVAVEPVFAVEAAKLANTTTSTAAGS